MDANLQFLNQIQTVRLVDVYQHFVFQSIIFCE